MTMSSSELSVLTDGHVRILQLNRPEVINALSNGLISSIVSAVTEAESDPEIRVVLIRSTSENFSSGYDVRKGYGRSGLDRPSILHDVQHVRSRAHTWRQLWEAGIPIICAVRGYCLAGGTDLVTHTDMVICSETARIGFPAVRSQGVPPTNMWTERVGLQWAKRLLLTGDLLSGTTAAKIGFAIDVVPDAELDEAALALARRVALIDKSLLMANKLAVNLGADMVGRGAMQEISAVFDAIGHRADGVVQFYEDVTNESLAGAWKRRNAPFAPDEPL